MHYKLARKVQEGGLRARTQISGGAEVAIESRGLTLYLSLYERGIPGKEKEKNESKEARLRGCWYCAFAYAFTARKGFRNTITRAV